MLLGCSGRALTAFVLIALTSARVNAQVPVYHLRVAAQPDSSWLSVTGTVRFAAADSARHELRLRLRAAFRDVRFALVRRGGETQLPAGLDTAGGMATWTLRADPPLPARMPVTLRFAYAGSLAGSEGIHLGPDGSFVETAWYPEDSAQSARDSRALGSLDIDVPAGYSAIATGVRQASPGAPARHYRFVTHVPRRLAFAVGKYSIARAHGALPIALYALRERPTAARDAERVAQYVGLLEREFGRIPYPSLTIVEVPTGPARSSGFGGRSVNGLVFVTSDNLEGGLNTAFIAHEISHQWWGDMVEPHGTDGEVFMLSEAMATYGALRVVTALEGSASAEHLRRVGYPGFEDSNLEYYLAFNVTGLDTVPLTQLRRLVLAHDLAATKGFRVIDMLSREVGQSAFRAALATFLRLHRFKTVTWGQFTAAMRRMAGRNLDWFFGEWTTRRTGIPEWTSDWSQRDGTVSLRVAQRGPSYRVGVEVRITGGEPADTVTHVVTLSASTNTASWHVPFTVRAVDIDPRFLVLHWLPDLARRLRGSAPALRGNWLDLLGEPARARAQYTAALDSVPTPDPWGLRYQLHYGVAWLYLRDKQWEQAARHMRDALSQDSTPSVRALGCRVPRGSCAVPWGYYVIARAAQAMGDSTQLCEAVAAADMADSSGRWGAAAAARALAPRCEPGVH